MSMFAQRTDLEQFLAVVHERSIFGAALRLKITQPALSRKISRLEKKVGGKLFVRTTRGVTPMELGSAAASMAKAVLKAMSQADAAVISDKTRLTVTRIDLARAVDQSLIAFESRASRHRWQELDQIEVLSLLTDELLGLYELRDGGSAHESAGALRRIAALALYGIASERGVGE